MNEIINVFGEPSDELQKMFDEIDRRVEEESKLVSAYKNGEEQTPFEHKRSEKLIDDYFVRLQRRIKKCK